MKTNKDGLWILNCFLFILIGASIIILSIFLVFNNKFKKIEKIDDIQTIAPKRTGNRQTQNVFYGDFYARIDLNGFVNVLNQDSSELTLKLEYQYFNKIKLNDEVKISSKFEVFKAKIIFISQDVIDKHLEVKASFDSTNLKILKNEPITATLSYILYKEVFYIPNYMLFEDREGYFVYLVDNIYEKVTVSRVEVLDLYGSYAVIKKGLKENDFVLRYS